MWKFNHAGSLDVEPHLKISLHITSHLKNSHYGKGKHNTIHPVSNSTEARREAEEDKVKEEVGIDTFPWSDQVGDNAKKTYNIQNLSRFKLEK